MIPLNQLILREISREAPNMLSFRYTVEGEWKRYFSRGPLWFIYPQSVSHVPDGVAVLPFVGNFLVLAAMLDARIVVPEIDRAFYDCIPTVIDGFRSIMPDSVSFPCRNPVQTATLIDTQVPAPQKDRSMLLFSGGADATYSLYAHREEHPALVTVWGADVPWEDERLWRQTFRHCRSTAQLLDVPLLPIRTNMRSVYQDDRINDLSYQLVGNWWWPAFHHGISMLTLTAPLAPGQYDKLYIGSSFSNADLSRCTSLATASAPQIDNAVRFCGCQVVHDGADCTRHQKLRYLVETTASDTVKPYLRVCYHSDTGENCCVCEKCARTIVSILLSGGKPEEYGFPYDAGRLYDDFSAGMQDMAKTEATAFLSFYQDLQDTLRRNPGCGNLPAAFRTFALLNLPEWAENCRKDAALDAACSRQLQVLQAETIRLQTILRDHQQVIPQKSRKANRKERWYYRGLRWISRRWPEGSRQHDYMKWRWWFICSDHYAARFRPLFDQLLSQYHGKLPMPKWLLRLDYHLSWLLFGAEPDDYFDYEFFRKGYRWRNHHITKHRLNFVDPLCNTGENLPFISEKTAFYSHWHEELRRTWCIPQDIPEALFCAMFRQTEMLVIKPVASFGGHGVRVISLNETSLHEVYRELHSLKDRCVCEAFIRQTGLLHEIYPESVNPLRVTTLRTGDTVEVLYAYLTTGCSGKRIANDCTGGIVFPIDLSNGKLGTGQGRSSNGHTHHPDTGVPVAGQMIPHWNAVLEYACSAHRKAPEGLDLIGWDICLSANGLCLIEGNRTPGFPELPDKHDDQWSDLQRRLDRLIPSTSSTA